MSKPVKTAAFGFLGPQALRVILANKGFHVSIFDGTEKSLTFRADGNNMVILSDLSKRNELGPYTDNIKYVIVLTKGQHNDAIELGLPIIDAQVDGMDIQMGPESTPTAYVQDIKNKSVPILFGAGKPTKKETAQKKKDQNTATKPTSSKPSLKGKKPVTLDGWLDLFDKHVDVKDFAVQVEYPVCRFLSGLSTVDVLKTNLKGLITNKTSSSIIKNFYKWLTGPKGTALSSAFKLHTDEGLPVAKAASTASSDAKDLKILCSVFEELN